MNGILSINDAVCYVSVSTEWQTKDWEAFVASLNRLNWSIEQQQQQQEHKENGLECGRFQQFNAEMVYFSFDLSTFRLRSHIKCVFVFVISILYVLVFIRCWTIIFFNFVLFCSFNQRKNYAKIECNRYHFRLSNSRAFIMAHAIILIVFELFSLLSFESNASVNFWHNIFNGFRVQIFHHRSEPLKVNMIIYEWLRMVCGVHRSHCSSA